MEQYASIKYFTETSFGSNKALLGFRSGGRTANEQPTGCRITTGGDIDVTGAYSTVLQKTILPLGRPETYTSGPNSKSYTLKKFLLRAIKKEH